MSIDGMRRCPGCGAQAGAKVLKCPLCGRMLPTIATPPSSTLPSPISPAVPRAVSSPYERGNAPTLPDTPTRQSGTQTIVVAFLAITAVAGFIVFLVSIQQKPSNSTQTATVSPVSRSTETASNRGTSRLPVATTNLPPPPPVIAPPPATPVPTNTSAGEEQRVAAYLSWLQGIVRARNQFVQQANIEMDKAEEITRNGINSERQIGMEIGFPGSQYGPMVTKLSELRNWYGQFLMNYDSGPPPPACQRLHLAFAAFLRQEMDTLNSELSAFNTVQSVAGSPHLRVREVNRIGEEARQRAEREAIRNTCMEEAKSVWRAFPNLPDALFDFEDYFVIEKKRTTVRVPSFRLRRR